MNYKDLKKRIDLLDFWDSKVLDFSINYFGDEVKMAIENDAEMQTCHVVKFISCYRVEYKTDANDEIWRNGRPVKSMNKCQLGHYVQNITIKESDEEGFLEVSINTSLLFATIICRSITFEQRKYKDSDFFWSRN